MLWEARIVAVDAARRTWTTPTLRGLVERSAEVLRIGAATGRRPRGVHGRAGRPCPRCGTIVQAKELGRELPRLTYWCPTLPARPEERPVSEAIDVRCEPTGDAWTCFVSVTGGGSTTNHAVTLTSADLARFAPDGATPDDLVRRSFEFLLAREPKDSILAPLRPAGDRPLLPRLRGHDHRAAIASDPGRPGRRTFHLVSTD